MYQGYVFTSIRDPLTHVAPLAMPTHNHGTLGGVRPTPPMFFPSQAPILSDMNTNMRRAYSRVYASTNSTKPHTPMSSSMRLTQLKSRAIGKTVYKVGLPTDAPISTKSVDASYTRSALRRVRNKGNIVKK